MPRKLRLSRKPQQQFWPDHVELLIFLYIVKYDFLNVLFIWHVTLVVWVYGNACDDSNSCSSIIRSTVDSALGSNEVVMVMEDHLQVWWTIKESGVLARGRDRPARRLWASRGLE